MNAQEPSSAKLQNFMVGLAALQPAEVRNAKILFIRNMIADYKADSASVTAQKVGMAFFGIIPLFWPLIIPQWWAMNRRLESERRHIQNAIEVWSEDLRGVTFESFD